MSNLDKYLASETWYLQPDKTRDKFGKIFDSKSVTMNTSTNGQGDRKISAEFKIPIFKVSSSFENGNTSHEEVIRDLAVQGMLRWILEDENGRSDLNCILEKGLIPSNKIYFDGKAKFCYDPNDNKNIIVEGLVTGRKFICNCSSKYFESLSSSRFKSILHAMDIIEEEYLDIFFIGTIFKQSTIFDSNKILLLDAIYIGGANKDLTDLYKIK